MTTEDKIKSLREKVDAIDAAFEKAPHWQVAYKNGLNEQAGRVEKEIKRFEYLNGLSPNRINETISCLHELLEKINEYSHIENEISNVKIGIEAELKEFSDELDRR